eukprot:tig00021168_g19093.t1
MAEPLPVQASELEGSPDERLPPLVDADESLSRSGSSAEGAVPGRRTSIAASSAKRLSASMAAAPRPVDGMTLAARPEAILERDDAPAALVEMTRARLRPRRNSWHGSTARRPRGPGFIEVLRAEYRAPPPPDPRASPPAAGSPPAAEAFDEDLHGDFALLTRESLRFDPDILASLRRMWAVALDGPEDEVLYFDRYKRFHAAVYRALNDRWDPLHALKTAVEDWDVDSGGQEFINRPRFLRCIFEIVDVWTLGISQAKYAGFLRVLYDTIARFDAALGRDVLRPLEEIKPGGAAALIGGLMSSEDAMERRRRRAEQMLREARGLAEGKRAKIYVAALEAPKPWAPPRRLITDAVEMISNSAYERLMQRSVKRSPSGGSPSRPLSRSSSGAQARPPRALFPPSRASASPAADGAPGAAGAAGAQVADSALERPRPRRDGLFGWALVRALCALGPGLAARLEDGGHAAAIVRAARRSVSNRAARRKRVEAEAAVAAAAAAAEDGAPRLPQIDEQREGDEGPAKEGGEEGEEGAGRPGAQEEGDGAPARFSPLGLPHWRPEPRRRASEPALEPPALREPPGARRRGSDSDAGPPLRPRAAALPALGPASPGGHGAGRALSPLIRRPSLVVSEGAPDPGPGSDAPLSPGHAPDPGPAVPASPQRQPAAGALGLGALRAPGPALADALARRLPRFAVSRSADDDGGGGAAPSPPPDFYSHGPAPAQAPAPGTPPPSSPKRAPDPPVPFVGPDSLGHLLAPLDLEGGPGPQAPPAGAAGGASSARESPPSPGGAARSRSLERRAAPRAGAASPRLLPSQSSLAPPAPFVGPDALGHLGPAPAPAPPPPRACRPWSAITAPRGARARGSAPRGLAVGSPPGPSSGFGRVVPTPSSSSRPRLDPLSPPEASLSESYPPPSRALAGRRGGGRPRLRAPGAGAGGGGARGAPGSLAPALAPSASASSILSGGALLAGARASALARSDSAGAGLPAPPPARPTARPRGASCGSPPAAAASSAPPSPSARAARRAPPRARGDPGGAVPVSRPVTLHRRDSSAGALEPPSPPSPAAGSAVGALHPRAAPVRSGSRGALRLGSTVTPTAMPWQRPGADLPPL